MESELNTPHRPLKWPRGRETLMYNPIMDSTEEGYIANDNSLKVNEDGSGTLYAVTVEGELTPFVLTAEEVREVQQSRCGVRRIAYFHADGSCALAPEDVEVR